MRLIGVLGVLCFAAAPALAGPVTYTFDVTSGSLTLEIQDVGSTTAQMGGNFVMTIYQSDCHIGASDSFLLEGCSLTNTTPALLSIAGVITANVGEGSARLTDFMQPEPSHIEAGGTSVANTDAYLEATVFVSGLTNITFETGTSAGELLPLDFLITTSVSRSDIATASLGLVFGYEIETGLDVLPVITLDLIFTVEGTAHVVPDPALGGLTALGLGGAGAWLRRRR